MKLYAVIVFSVLFSGLCGCALIRRPAIVNERMKEEPFVMHQEGLALQAWTYCIRAAVETWEAQNPKYASIMTVKDVLSVPDICGPYPGHAAQVQYTPDAKGSSMFSMPLMPALAPILPGIGQ